MGKALFGTLTAVVTGLLTSVVFWFFWHAGWLGGVDWTIALIPLDIGVIVGSSVVMRAIWKSKKGYAE